MSKKIAVVLSGCGFLDGSEINEAVLAHLALVREGLDVQFVAPDIPQAHVVDHGRGAEATGEMRNVLREAARIARGKVRDLATVAAGDFDGIVFPGGYGAAKNLSTFAFDGSTMRVNDSVAGFIRDAAAASIPMCFICIAPVIAAAVMGEGVELTIGSDAGTAAAVERMGARHVNTAVTGWHVDTARLVVSTGAFMYGDAPITDVERGISGAIREFAKLVQ